MTYGSRSSAARLPQRFVRHVQIPLGRLEVCVTQQKLNRPQVKAARQPTAGGLVPQIVPVQIDLRELLAIDPSSCPGIDPSGCRRRTR